MKVLAIGLNYKDHVLESGIPMPQNPFLFNKTPTSIIGDGDPIIIPKLSTFVDYEVELVVVIGATAKHVKEDNAFDYIQAYTIANDVTARDIQRIDAPSEFFISKNFDTFCPLKWPYVNKDKINDPHSLNISLRVNGETRQSSNTKHLIFKIPKLISWISQRMTLHKGDILLTGTPSGVGSAQKPPAPLKPGDVVDAEIEGIGILKNPVIAENA